ncbi:MAG: caspase family protein [bacterium]|nr:caspase family protein [bacterium]
MAEKYALIIGIENYPEKSGQEKAAYARNDADAMAQYAKKAGFNLIGGKALIKEK